MIGLLTHSHTWPYKLKKGSSLWLLHLDVFSLAHPNPDLKKGDLALLLFVFLNVGYEVVESALALSLSLTIESYFDWFVFGGV